MNTAVINIKVEPATKKQAHKVAHELGLSLSGILNGFLKQLIQTKRVTFAVNDEELTEYAIRAIKKAEENRIKGKGSPIFKSGKEAVAWLEKQGI